MNRPVRISVGCAAVVLLAGCSTDLDTPMAPPATSDTSAPPPPPPPAPSPVQQPVLAFTGTLGRLDSANNEVFSTDIYVTRSTGGVIRLTTDAAEDAEPSWSPDRASLAFRSRRDGNDEIYTMNADGHGVTRLTSHSAADYEPAWSPDGSRIAFVSERDGTPAIYVMTTSGADVARLTSGSSPARSPAWSPDARRIAFSSGPAGKAEIFVMNADGSGVERLTNNEYDDVDPAWSPDGTRIAFSRFRRDLVCTPVDSIDMGTDLEGYERMCPWDILVMRSDGSSPIRLGLPEGVGRQDGMWRGVFVGRDPAWSPDGSQIAASVFYCLSDMGGADCHGHYAMVLVSPSGAAGITEVKTGLVSEDYRMGPRESSPAWRP